MNLVDIYKKEKKPEETKKVSTSDTSVKKLVDKFSIFASISTNIRLIRQDIAKLVKIQGVKPTTKAESFFLSQKEKENVYESKLQKIKPTTPTKVETKATKTESSSPFDFIKDIFSFLIKGGILTAFIGGIGKLLEDPEIRKSVKEFFVGAIESVLNGVRQATTFIGEILQDDRVIQSIVDTVKLIFSTLKDVIVKIWNFEVETESGKFSVGDILKVLVGALVAFKLAVIAASAVLGAIATGIGSGVGRPGAPGSPGGKTPVPGTPGGAGPAGRPPVPGAPPTAGAPATGTPGFQRTAEDLIRERAARIAGEKGAKSGVQGVLNRFIAGTLGAGPIGALWLSAYTVYEIADRLAPDEQQQFIDSLEVIASVQSDIDAINAEQNTPESEKKKRIDILVKRSNLDLYKSRLEKLTKPKSPSASQQSTQTVPEAPNESAAETARLAAAAAAGKPTSVPSEKDPRARSYTSPTPASSQTGPNTNVRLDDEQRKMASLIFNRFKEAGFTDEQANAAIVNAYAESRLRPEAKSPVTPKEESYGLFQMNTKGGLGQGHDPQKLMDPNYNITLAIEAAKKSKSFVASKNLDEAVRAFTIEVERPANMMTEAEKRVNIASSILGTSMTPTAMAATTAPTSMAAAPTGGQKVMAASADFSDFMRQVLQPTVNVVAPTTNVQQAAMPRTQQNYTQPSVVDTEFMKLLVGRTVNL